jgi:hypothetical protein
MPFPRRMHVHALTAAGAYGPGEGQPGWWATVGHHELKHILALLRAGGPRFPPDPPYPLARLGACVYAESLYVLQIARTPNAASDFTVPVGPLRAGGGEGKRVRMCARTR